MGRATRIHTQSDLSHSTIFLSDFAIVCFILTFPISPMHQFGNISHENQHPNLICNRPWIFFICFLFLNTSNVFFFKTKIFLINFFFLYLEMKRKQEREMWELACGWVPKWEKRFLRWKCKLWYNLWIYSNKNS